MPTMTVSDARKHFFALIKDAKKLSSSGLRPNAEKLLKILTTDPSQNPPPYEALVGNLIRMKCVG